MGRELLILRGAEHLLILLAINFNEDIHCIFGFIGQGARQGQRRVSKIIGDWFCQCTSSLSGNNVTINRVLMITISSHITAVSVSFIAHPRPEISEATKHTWNGLSSASRISITLRISICGLLFLKQENEVMHRFPLK